jgi:hypothetical protein
MIIRLFERIMTTYFDTLVKDVKNELEKFTTLHYIVLSTPTTEYDENGDPAVNYYYEITGKNMRDVLLQFLEDGHQI